MALTFFWRMENSTTLDATHDHSAGDTTATSDGNATFGTGQVRVGTYSGLHSTATTKYFDFDIANICQTTTPYDVSVGFWFRSEDLANHAPRVAFDYLLADDNLIVGPNNSGFLVVEANDSGWGNDPLTLTGTAMTSNNWYFCVGAFFSDTDTQYGAVYDTNLSAIQGPSTNTISNSNFWPTTNSLTTMRIGQESGAGADNSYMDNIMVGSYADRTLLPTYALYTSYQQVLGSRVGVEVIRFV